MADDLVGILLGIGFKNTVNPVGKINFDKIRVITPHKSVTMKTGNTFKVRKSNSVLAMTDKPDLFRIP